MDGTKATFWIHTEEIWNWCVVAVVFNWKVQSKIYIWMIWMWWCPQSATHRSHPLTSGWLPIPCLHPSHPIITVRHVEEVHIARSPLGLICISRCEREAGMGVFSLLLCYCDCVPVKLCAPRKNCANFHQPKSLPSTNICSNHCWPCAWLVAGLVVGSCTHYVSSNRKIWKVNGVVLLRPKSCFAFDGHCTAIDPRLRCRFLVWKMPVQPALLEVEAAAMVPCLMNQQLSLCLLKICTIYIYTCTNYMYKYKHTYI